MPLDPMEGKTPSGLLPIPPFRFCGNGSGQRIACEFGTAVRVTTASHADVDATRVRASRHRTASRPGQSRSGMITRVASACDVIDWILSANRSGRSAELIGLVRVFEAGLLQGTFELQARRAATCRVSPDGRTTNGTSLAVWSTSKPHIDATAEANLEAVFPHGRGRDLDRKPGDRTATGVVVGRAGVRRGAPWSDLPAPIRLPERRGLAWVRPESFGMLGAAAGASAVAASTRRAACRGPGGNVSIWLAVTAGFAWHQGGIVIRIAARERHLSGIRAAIRLTLRLPWSRRCRRSLARSCELAGGVAGPFWPQLLPVRDGARQRHLPARSVGGMTPFGGCGRVKVSIAPGRRICVLPCAVGLRGAGGRGRALLRCPRAARSPSRAGRRLPNRQCGDGCIWAGSACAATTATAPSCSRSR